MFGISVWNCDMTISLDRLEHTCMPFSKDRLYNILRECIQKKDLAGGRRVQSIIFTRGLCEIDVFSNHLIRLFTSCGCLLEANLTFCKISQPNVLSWEAIISSHVTLGQQELAFMLYHTMKEEGIELNRCIFLSILKGCAADGKSVKQGMIMHSEIIRSGFDVDKAVMNSLVDMYAKSGNLNEAQILFDKLPNRDLVSYGAMITGYTLHGHGSLALDLFERLQEQGEKHDKVTFLTTLKACSNEGAIRQGRLIHTEIIKYGFQSDVSIGSALVDMYAKCGSIKEAQQTFDTLQHRNIVSWGAMIAGYVQHGYGTTALQLFESMFDHSLTPDKVIFLSALKACGIAGFITEGRWLHDQIVRYGYTSDPIVCSSLIDMYGNCGSLNEAQKIFSSLRTHDVVLWSALISVYAQNNEGHSALQHFEDMIKDGTKPNSCVLANALKACSVIGDVRQGSITYDQAIKSGMDSDAIVGSSVVDMYAKHGCIQEAQKVFDISPNQDVVLWGSLIAGYSLHGYGLMALLVFANMRKKNVRPSNFIFSSVLKACAGIGALEEGKLIYDEIIKNNLDSDVVIGNTLVDMYSSCESLEEARNVFDRVQHVDMISWNAMITGYSKQKHASSALELFDTMHQRGMIPDKVTFSCVLKLAGYLASLTIGKHIHNQVMKNQLETDVVIGTALIDMYGVCGGLYEARQVFDTLQTRNWFSWCALIAGYAQHEQWQHAVQCINEMQCQGFKPDDRIHTVMLAACSQLGELKEGHCYFKSLKEVYGSLPNEEHFNCMIDLFARSGNFSEALEMIKTMPSSPDVTGWMSLLTASKKFSHTKIGGDCFDQLVHLDPNVPAAYMFMADIYSNTNMTEKACRVQSMKRFANAWKKPARACIEVDNVLHELVVGDETCTPNNEIRLKTQRLGKLIQSMGHLPNLEIQEPRVKETRERSFDCEGYNNNVFPRKEHE